MNVRLFFKRILLAGGLIALTVFSFVVFVNVVIVRSASEILSLEQAPTSSLALIFGGGMKNAVEMSDMQWDRVEVGAQLFKNGRVERLMITGDDGNFRADEITAMTNRLVELGVPTSSISADPHGYRTYESCFREARVYGITKTIVISQSFHLPRIQYFCEHFGIHTVPVHADLRAYDSWWTPKGREWLARLKGWWQVTVTRPGPMTWAR